MSCPRLSRLFSEPTVDLHANIQHRAGLRLQDLHHHSVFVCRNMFLLVSQKRELPKVFTTLTSWSNHEIARCANVSIQLEAPLWFLVTTARVQNKNLGIILHNYRSKQVAPPPDHCCRLWFQMTSLKQAGSACIWDIFCTLYIIPYYFSIYL